MNTITKDILKGWQSEGKELVLVDVREVWEHENYNIGGLNIPLGELIPRREELEKNALLVIYCEKGIRSAIAIQRLESYGYTNMYNLEGGMSKWRSTPD